MMVAGEEMGVDLIGEVLGYGTESAGESEETAGVGVATMEGVSTVEGVDVVSDVLKSVRGVSCDIVDGTGTVAGVTGAVTGVAGTVFGVIVGVTFDVFMSAPATISS